VAQKYEVIFVTPSKQTALLAWRKRKASPIFLILSLSKEKKWESYTAPVRRDIPPGGTLRLFTPAQGKHKNKKSLPAY